MSGRVKNVLSVHGREVSAEESAESSMVTVMMYAVADLVLKEDIEITFVTSIQQPLTTPLTTPIRILIQSEYLSYFNTQHLYQQGVTLINHNELVIPWMNDTKKTDEKTEKVDLSVFAKNDLSVFFYAIRQLLLNEAFLPWRTPISLEPYFPTLSQTIQIQSVALVVGCGRVKGGRAYMEDVDVHFESIAIGKRAVQLLGVFDGHGGKDCATHVSEELPVRLSAILKAQSTSNAHTSISSAHIGYGEALFKCFLAVDEEYLSSGSTSAGCTATVFLWASDVSIGYLASVGDSRAVLNRGGTAIDMTIDHKASDPDTVAYVLQQGGSVSSGRINSLLAVGRAFGDSILKVPRSKTNLLRVTPDILTYVPHPNDAFILIASDGLWDVLTSQQAIDLIASKLEQLGHNTITDVTLNRICEGVVEYAYKELHSKDNITLAIVLLDRTNSVSLSVSMGTNLGENQSNLGGNQGNLVRNMSNISGNQGNLGRNMSNIGGNSVVHHEDDDIDSLLDKVSRVVSGNSSSTGGNSSSTGGNSSSTGGNSSSTGGNSSNTSTGGRKTEGKPSAVDDDYLDFLRDDRNF